MFNDYGFNEDCFNADTGYFRLTHPIKQDTLGESVQKLNHVLVIGLDVDGNVVYGADENTTQIGLLGENLQIRIVPEASTAALCTSIADAIITKERLNTKRGILVSNPNCGVEMFDVESITDEHANADAALYRVLGIETTYDTMEKKYQQTLTLGAV